MTTDINATSNRPRAARSVFSKLSALRLIVLLTTTGCQSAQAPDEAPKRAEAVAEAPTQLTLVEGWGCHTVDSCFGLKVGRSRTFERRVGKSVGQESWTFVEATQEGLVSTYAQEGGPELYRVDPTGLSLSYGGELLPAVRFPVRFGVAFSVHNAQGSRVTMHVERSEGVLETPAGNFEGCILHKARFSNPEQPEAQEMVVETTLCEGVGEVQKRIKLPSLPNPIEFTLLAKEQV